MDRLTEIKNKIARTILMVIGTVVASSVFYRHIIWGFNVEGAEELPWTTKEWILLGISFFLMLGAAYFNKLIKLIFNYIERKTSK